VFVHIQLGVSKYKLGKIPIAQRKFEDAKLKFARSSEVYNYYGEILMDMQKFDEAEQEFDKAIEINPKNPLAYINKSILLAQKGRIPDAETTCRLAIEADPACDIGYTQLAQLMCHQNKIDEAIEIYERAVGVCRTATEVANVVSCLEAARAQGYVLKKFPEAMKRMAPGGQ
jgi:mitochondrial import receptor subunit TOM70